MEIELEDLMTNREAKEALKAFEKFKGTRIEEEQYSAIFTILTNREAFEKMIDTADIRMSLTIEAVYFSLEYFLSKEIFGGNKLC